MKLKLFIIFTLIIFVPACEKREVSQSSPEAALRKFIDGFLQLNKTQVMASVYGSKLEKEGLAVFIDYLIEVQSFKKAVVNKYGSRGWKYFETDGGAKLSMSMTADSTMIDSAKIRVGTERATCILPDKDKVIHLKIKNGIWYVDAADAFSTNGSSLRNYIKTWTDVTGIIKKAKQRIGQDGVTAESLDEEMGVELSAVLLANR